MQASDRYAPPRAHVADVPASREAAEAPALWNPFAAGCWSLLFTPIFGAFLHMKNWEALGQAERARASKQWVIGGVVFFVVLLLAGAAFPDSKFLDKVSQPAGIGLLFGWYFSSGKAQQTYVKERFGADYERRGWLKPILLAIGAFVAFFLAAMLIAVVIGV